MKRTVSEILECSKTCRPGEAPNEIWDITYKIRNQIPLNSEESDLWKAYSVRGFKK